MNRSSVKELFLKSLQYSQKNTCVGVSFWISMQGFSPETWSKRGFNKGFFPMNIAKFLRTPVFKNICERLFEHFPIWENNITSNIGIEEDIFSKKKKKKRWKITPLCCYCPISTLLGFLARKCCIAICIVIANNILVTQRRI